jgi:hypothetical protein
MPPMIPRTYETILCPYCNSNYQSNGDMFPVQDRDGHWMVVMHRCPNRECWRMVLRLDPSLSVETPRPGGQAESRPPTAMSGVPRRPITLWPRTTAPHVDASVPKPFAELFREAWDVLPWSPRASAALSRRCLQQLLREHYKIKAKNLEDEIDAVIATKQLPSHINDELHAVRSVGNFAAHPQKNLVTGDIVDPEPDEANWLLSLLQAVFDSTFVEPARHAARKRAWNTKAASAGKPTI